MSDYVAKVGFAFKFIIDILASWRVELWVAHLKLVLKVSLSTQYVNALFKIICCNASPYRRLQF